jgi:hypothetical protein
MPASVASDSERADELEREREQEREQERERAEREREERDREIASENSAVSQEAIAPPQDLTPPPLPEQQGLEGTAPPSQPSANDAPSQFTAPVE